MGCKLAESPRARLSQLPGAGLAPRSLLRCPRSRGVATAAGAALGGEEAPPHVPPLPQLSPPVSQAQASLLDLSVTPPLDLSSWLFFLLFIFFFKNPLP